MREARFSEKQQAVTISKPGDLTIVQIAINERPADVVDPQTGEKTGEEYAYDWNEFQGIDGTDFDITEIQKSPEKYLDFTCAAPEPVVGHLPETTVHKLEKATQKNTDAIASMNATIDDLVLQSLEG